MATGSDDRVAWDTTSCSGMGQPLPGQVPAEQSQDTSTCLSTAEWPLRHYGRFLPGALDAASGSWKVLESKKESGFLVLTIVISGHFFISKGKEVLEGFSLIDASQWLKIVRNADCMLFSSKTKNKRRMFRIRFEGDSKTQAQERCYNCVQKLAEYVPIQVADAPSQELQQGHSLLLDNGRQLKEAEQNVLTEYKAENLTSAQGRVSVAELAQHVLGSRSELPLAYQQSMWKSEDLGSFIRLCLLDRGFPAFVADVEKQLKKITEE